MTTEPLFFKPVFKERIWGGTALADFGYTIPSQRTGECWAFAAHQNGQSVVQNGMYKGFTLSELWEHHRHLFGQLEGDRFPLLTKILDADQDLSVQVHPNDEYANIHENGELGKTECWYIIDCQKDAEIIYGHNATTKEELTVMIERGEWDELLRRVKVKPGDFFMCQAVLFMRLEKEFLLWRRSRTQTQPTDYMIMTEKMQKASCASFI